MRSDGWIQFSDSHSDAHDDVSVGKVSKLKPIPVTQGITDDTILQNSYLLLNLTKLNYLPATWPARNRTPV
jgi:hypothetical protein